LDRVAITLTVSLTLIELATSLSHRVATEVCWREPSTSTILTVFFLLRPWSGSGMDGKQRIEQLSGPGSRSHQELPPALSDADLFPSNPPAPVNSPVQVMVNGTPAEMIGTFGYPGSVDGYQVNFRVPPDTRKGTVSIEVTAAWISSSPVGIAVQ
jgi:hypothetical protein